jgi:hypothetical protein
MNFENIILSTVNQTYKDNCCLIPLIPRIGTFMEIDLLFKYVKRFLDMMKILKMVNGNGCATL